jgi:ABC-type branched-subunit amino acid transport system substrate-binding protein
MRLYQRKIVTGAVLLAMTLTPLVLTEASASAAPAPIKIALISSLTGQAASEFSTSAQGFNARIALQNAMGGVNGHKIEGIVIDDQTSPSSDPTAVQDAVSKGVTGIVSVSPLFFLGAKYAQQAGIPVTGGYFDGPEWGTKPYTNMFASDAGSVDPKYPVSSLYGNIVKKYGGTVVGSYGYGISPSAVRSATGFAESAQRQGLKVGVLDVSVPYGGVNFTTEALAAKQKSVNTVWASMDDNSDFALVTAMKQAGMKLKTVILPTGYESSVVNSPAWADLQGAYFFSGFRPLSIPNAGTKQLASALQKYEHRSPSDFPTYNIYEAWVGADLMIKGLELAGKNPTSASVIKSLRGLKSYNANGLLPVSNNYSNNFGHDQKVGCQWVLQAKKSGFVLTSAQPVCGSDIPGTSTASAGS